MADDQELSESKGGERTPAQWAKYWQREVKAAQKRLTRFTKRGNQTVERYLDKRGGESAYDDTNALDAVRRLNLFHTNVTTMKSMLYGSTPRVDVSREHHDPDDDVARVAGLMFQRILQADVQPSGKDVPNVLQNCLEDRLLPGLGVARIRYAFQTETMPYIDPQTGMVEQGEQVVWEDAPINYVHWQDFLWGWCRTWDELPWMGFRAWLDKGQAEERFGETVAKQLQYKNQTPTGAKEDDSTEKDQENNIQKAEIWEIWCKEYKSVYWYSPGSDLILDVVEDPLELDGFWPIPRPMIANVSTTLFEPVADFAIAQDIYNQIDQLYTRVCIITQAIKVVGVYDQSASDSVGRMLKEGMENDLIPVENWAMFGEKGGLKGVIDWFPVQDVVGTLQTLRQVLGEQIDLLNQVTGMSDILRGANTDQYTSDGTNQLTAKFGSVRIQSLQEEFARFASDLEALKAEVISKHFQPATIRQQSAADFLPAPDREYVQQALALMKSTNIKWRIDIRPESIAMVDYAQLKSERTEFLTAMATYLQSAQAVVQAVPGSLPILLEMLKWGMAGFKGANYLEGIMDRAIDMASKPQQGQGQDGPSPEQVKLETEKMKAQTAQMKVQGDLQKVQVKAQADMQVLQTKISGEMQKIQAELQNDTGLADQQLRSRLTELATEFQNDMELIREQLRADVTVEEAQSTFALVEENTDHQNALELLRAQPRNSQNRQ